MLPIQDCDRSGKFPFWVAIIVLINFIIFYFESTPFGIDNFIYNFALIPANVNLGDISTFPPFFSSQFLHGGILHLGINMWFLWIFGENVEHKLGFLLFPIFYLLSGALGGFLQYSFSPDSNIPNLGASGAVAGVMGVYFAFFPKNQIQTLIPFYIIRPIIDLPAALILIYWFLIQALNSAGFAVLPAAEIMGGIAYLAHVGGFISGFLMGKFFSYFYLDRPNPSGINKLHFTKTIFP